MYFEGCFFATSVFEVITINFSFFPVSVYCQSPYSQNWLLYLYVNKKSQWRRSKNSSGVLWNSENAISTLLENGWPSEKELEALVNEFADDFDTITYDQAEDSDIGGDSDADDDLPLASIRSSVNSTPSSSGQIVEESHIRKRKTLSESGSETESEEEKRRHEKATKQKQNDNFVYSVSEDENGKDPQLFTESNYSQPFGPRIVPTDFRSPIGYFLLFFSNMLMELIIEQTKLYAEQKKQKLS